MKRDSSILNRELGGGDVTNSFWTTVLLSPTHHPRLTWTDLSDGLPVAALGLPAPVMMLRRAQLDKTVKSTQTWIDRRCFSCPAGLGGGFHPFSDDSLGRPDS